MSEDVGLDTFSPAPDGQSNHPPPQIPDHNILRKIGAGKYGEVWLARNIMGDYRAVKVVYRSSFQETRPFDREFEGLKAFSKTGHHPSQVNIYHVGRNETEGCFYSVMDLADDQVPREKFDPDLYAPRTIRSELDQHGNLPPDQCVKFALVLASALEHLHSRKLIHRDIKPANVIFVGGQPKLADIGLVAVANEDCSFVGTEGYVPPEGPGKPQADIYSFGKVLYRMLTGLPVGQFPTLPADWSTKPNRLAQELNLVVAKACEPNPQHRYRAADELRKELAILDIGDSLRSRRKWEKLQHQFRSYGPWVAVILVGGIASFGAYIFKRRAAEQDHRRELRELGYSRLRSREAGWFDRSVPSLRRTARFREDDDFYEQFTAVLAGMDAHRLKLNCDIEASSAVSAPDGRILAGGVREQPAMLVETNGNVLELPVKGEGPVCWTAQGTPFQLTTVSNAFVLRNAANGQIVRTFANPNDIPDPNRRPVLALSSGGGLIAGSLRKMLRIYETATGSLLAEFPFGATALAFSPDASLLAVGEQKGTTRVYSTRDYHEMVAFPCPSGSTAIRCVAFGYNSNVPYEGPNSIPWLLAAATQGADLTIWDVQRRTQLVNGSISAAWVPQALAFRPDGTVLAALTAHGSANLLDTATARELLRLTETGRPGWALAWDSQGKRLFCGGENAPGAEPQCGLWEVEEDHGIHTLRGLKSSTRKIWISNDSRCLAALANNWHVGIWNIESNRLLYVFEVQVGGYADSAGGTFDSKAQTFAFAAGKEARLYSLATGATLQKWELPYGLSDQLRFDRKGRLLLLRRERSAGSERMDWRLYELAAGEQAKILHEQKDPDWYAFDVFLSGDGDHFLVRDDGSEIQIIRGFDVDTGSEIWKIASIHEESPNATAIDPIGRAFCYRPIGQNRKIQIMGFSDFRKIGDAVPEMTTYSLLGPKFQDGYLFPDPHRPNYKILIGTDWQQGFYVSSFSPDARYIAWGTAEGPILVADIPEVQRRLALLH